MGASRFMNVRGIRGRECNDPHHGRQAEGLLEVDKHSHAAAGDVAQRGVTLFQGFNRAYAKDQCGADPIR